VTVIPHGVLFRGGGEQAIRIGFLKDDLVEAVIGLPTNVFYGASIPAALLVINKAKSAARKGKVLFVDASLGFEKAGNKNRLRDEDIERIDVAFDAFTDEEKYAKVVELGEIEKNEFNLNISRYVDKTEAEDEIDIEAVLEEIRELKGKVTATEEKLNKYLQGLGFHGV